MSIKDKDFLRTTATACRNAIYVVGLFSFFINLLMLTTAIYMLQVYDRVLASRSYDTLIYLTLAAMIALFALMLLDIARSRVLVHVSYWLDNTLSQPAMQRSADEMLLGRRYGPQALRDIATVRQFVSGASIITLFDTPWVPIYLLAILYLSPYLFLVAAIGTVLLFTLAIINEMVTRSLLAEAGTKAISSQYYVDASLRNAEVIQAMGMMPNILKHWNNKNSIVLTLQTIASNRAGAILAISKFMRLVLQILMLCVGAFLVIGNQLTGGGMIAGTILLGRALAPVEQAISVWKQLVSARQAYQRLQLLYASSLRVESDIQLPVPAGKLDIENVIYRTNHSEKLILANISFQVKPGEMIAIIGPSGAGKSTLARLIMGVLKPTNGCIRLDGVDVYAWERTDFGRHVGYLPQDIELFTGTVKDNIARMGQVDDESVVAAAQLAQVHDMILRLPNAYETKIGSQSYVLSGGMRQRIALARSLYRSPKLLVLDEPNSNLDNEGELALSGALQAMKSNGATQIVITHKPSLVKYVDTIIFIAEGKIRMAGPRDKVLAELKNISQQVKKP